MIYILLLVLKVYAINLIVTTSNPNEVSLSGGLLIPKSANSITLESALMIEPSEQLHVQVSQSLMSVQFCHRFSKIQTLTQAEFNDPSIKTFMDVTLPQSWRELIGDAGQQNLDTIASLYVVGSWRCKEYFQFEYNSELDAQKSDVSLKARALFRQYLDVKDMQRDSKRWSLVLSRSEAGERFSMHLEGNFTHRTYPIIGGVDLIVRHGVPATTTYTVKRWVEGQGLHQSLHTSIKMDELPQEGCKVVVLDHLDVYSYVDKDELDKLGAKYRLQTIVDIERPSSMSQQHVFLSEHQMVEGNTLNYSHQYHFRYQPSSDRAYEKAYVPQQPEVYLDCLGGVHQQSDAIIDHTQLVQQIFGRQYVQIAATGQSFHPIEVQVPVGYAPHKQIISVVTIGVTLGMSLYLGRVIQSSTFQ